MAEVPPLDETEVSSLIGGNVVRRMEPSSMQLVIDRMIEKGGGTDEVCTKNNMPVPGLEANEDTRYIPGIIVNFFKNKMY